MRFWIIVVLSIVVAAAASFVLQRDPSRSESGVSDPILAPPDEPAGEHGGLVSSGNASGDVSREASQVVQDSVLLPKPEAKPLDPVPPPSDRQADEAIRQATREAGNANIVATKSAGASFEPGTSDVGSAGHVGEAGTRLQGIPADDRLPVADPAAAVGILPGEGEVDLHGPLPGEGSPQVEGPLPGEGDPYISGPLPGQ